MTWRIRKACTRLARIRAVNNSAGLLTQAAADSYAGMRAAAQVLLWVLPWFVRRPLLCLLFGFRIDRAARIGFSVLAVGLLEMAEGARIGHLTYAKGLEPDRAWAATRLLGPLNWITAYPAKGRDFFTHVADRAIRRC